MSNYPQVGMPVVVEGGTNRNGGVDKGTATWTFETTPRIASYITAVIAGPYHAEHRELTSQDGRTIPLGVYCRGSLAEHLDTDNIVDLTRAGFDFYERAFGVPYPFTKYDQLFVPEFNAGAMENAGAVTFLESYVFRSKVPEATIERRAVTILHELAHMWFGDLVTMRWWDDLWLNESFAEYMSTLATAAGHPLDQRLDHVLLDGEELGLPAGPAALHAPDRRGHARPGGRRGQLRRHHVRQGRERAQAAGVVGGPGRVLRRRPRLLRQARVGQHRAARLPHRARGHQRPRPVRVVRPLAGAGGRHAAAAVARGRRRRASSPRSPSCRRCPTSTPCSVRTASRSAATTCRRAASCGPCHVELDIDGPRTEVPQLVGVQRPTLLLVNDDDLAYAKVRLDEQSLAASIEHLGKFDDSLPRTLVWTAAWDATRDGETPARDFVDLVLNNIAHETDSSVVLVLLRQLSTALDLYVAPEHRSATETAAADRLLALARAAEAGSDTQLQLVKSLRRPGRDHRAARRRPGPAGRSGDARRACPSTPTCAGSCSPRW